MYLIDINAAVGYLYPTVCQMETSDNIRNSFASFAYFGQVVEPTEEYMVTCFLKYTIDPFKVKEFEVYAKKWIPLVHKYGGKHHGYFLPHEGANNMAVALFSFDSLAAYERYRKDSSFDDECQEAYQYALDTRCILSYERSFMRPLLD